MPTILAVLLAFWMLRCAAPAAAQDAGPAAADSVATPDSLPPSGAVNPDSARRLDSLAVAALTDTAALPVPVGAGTPVLFFGKRIFDVYSGLGPYTPAERAERIRNRLEVLARTGAPSDSLRVVDGLELTTIHAGEAIILSVTDADGRGLGLPRRQAASFYAETIRQEIDRLRERTTLRHVLTSLGFSVVLLILLVLLLKGLGRLYRATDRKVASWHGTYIRPLTFRNIEVLPADRIARATLVTAALARGALSLLLVYLFLTTVFGLFPWTQSWSRQLLHYALVPIRGLWEAVVEGFPNLLAIVVILVIIRWLVQLSNTIFAHVSRGTLEVPGFYPEFAEPTRKIVRFLLIILGIMLIYPYTPIVDSPVFQGLTVFLGILFSLGSSTAIANMVAGVVLTYTRSFQIGDRIRVGETLGDVVEKTFLVTRLRTAKNEDVSVPNLTVLSSPIVNYTTMVRAGQGIILHTTVTIGYDVHWSVVHRLLVEAARATPGVEPAPEPFVLQTALGDFSVSYQINVYTLDPSRMARIYSDLHRNIQDRFMEAGVEILSPVYEAGRDGNRPAIPRGSDIGEREAGEDGSKEGKRVRG